MKLGIFGGTFDPIHYGHLILAETCREACELDEIWFMPAFLNPHKLGRTVTPTKARLEMVRFAIAGNSTFRVSNLEAKRTEPSYTVETLRTIKQERPTDELFLLLGGDSIADFPNWKEPNEILNLATLVAVNRGREVLDLRGVREAFGETVDQRVVEVRMPAIDLSATELRQRIRDGQSIRYRTPRSVELYLTQNRIYTATRQD